MHPPFDIRPIYYVPWMVDWPRAQAMPHMLAGENVGLDLCRQTVASNWCHIFLTNQITDDSYVSNRTRERGYLFPLYLYPEVGKVDHDTFTRWPPCKDARRPNLDPAFVETIEQTASLTFTSDGRGDLDRDFGPEDVLAYIYAVFHWPDYRRRYAPMLRLDFPRVPRPAAR